MIANTRFLTLAVTLLGVSCLPRTSQGQIDPLPDLNVRLAAFRDYVTGQPAGGPACEAPVAAAGCDHPVSDGCAQCRPTLLWADVEYLMWFTHGRELPLMAATSVPNTPREAAAVEGLPTTLDLFGGERIGRDLGSGGRVTFGTWTDETESLGYGGRLFGLRSDRGGFYGDGDSYDILGQPFVNALTGLNDSALIVYPGLVTGQLSILASNDIYGAEAFVRVPCHSGRGYCFDLIGGYHFTRINDDVVANSVVEFLSGPVPPIGTTITTRDRFSARNEFHGGQLGLTSTIRYDRVKLTSLVKCSVGNMNEVVKIVGSSEVVTPGGSSITSDSGFYAVSSNSGEYRRDRTAVVPEIGITLRYALTPSWEVSMGYSAIYWNHVVLAGDQIDTTINPLLIGGGGPPVGPARPEFRWRETDFWAQGMNFGLVWNY